ARPILAARDAHADEVQPLGAVALLAPARVLEPGVAAVDDDVALLEEGRQLLQRHVDGRAGLDHHEDAARPRQLGDELLQRLRAAQLLARVLGQELVGGLGLEVPRRDVEAVLLDVQGQVPAHHGETDDAERCAAHVVSSSLAAAAGSRSQVARRARWIGYFSGCSGPLCASATCPALPAPLAATSSARAAAMTSGVIESRSGGGLGAPATGMTFRPRTPIQAPPGNSDAVCRSSPMPRTTTSSASGRSAS